MCSQRAWKYVWKNLPNLARQTGWRSIGHWNFFPRIRESSYLKLKTKFLSMRFFSDSSRVSISARSLSVGVNLENVSWNLMEVWGECLSKDTELCLTSKEIEHLFDRCKECRPRDSGTIELTPKFLEIVHLVKNCSKFYEQSFPCHCHWT